MSEAQDQHLLEALLDSWDRNNVILINLLRASPRAGSKPKRPKAVHRSRSYSRTSTTCDAGREMELHYDHPILLVQHMLWHEGYHHAQIKLALEVAGHAISDEKAGPVTWDVWMRKNPGDFGPLYTRPDRWRPSWSEICFRSVATSTFRNTLSCSWHGSS
jgi:hypothetical protein